jgi:hypothetical protein
MSAIEWPYQHPSGKPTFTVEGKIIIGTGEICTARGDCVVQVRNTTFVTSLRYLGVRTLVHQFRKPKGRP